LAKPSKTSGTPEDRLIAASRSWDDFGQRVEALKTTKARVDAFGRLTQLYLEVAPAYRTRIRRVWLLDEVPASIRKKLNFPGPDEGIDLVAQERDGSFWAIQAKFRSDKGRALTRNDCGGLLHALNHGRSCVVANPYRAVWK